MKTKDIAKLTGVEKEKLISSLKTLEEALALYHSCPKDMEPAVMEKLEEITTLAIPLLKTKEEARALFEFCPSSMDSAVIKAMAKL